MLRILPPSLSRGYAVEHDNALWQGFYTTFATQASQGDSTARNVATLPGQMGGLGLRSAARLAVPAYWASLVNTLNVLSARAPSAANEMLLELQLDGGSDIACSREAQQCSQVLLIAGALDLPTWAEAKLGAKPPPPDGIDPADLDRGWQCHASSLSEQLFLERVVKPSADVSRKALLLSQAGEGAQARGFGPCPRNQPELYDHSGSKWQCDVVCAGRSRLQPNVVAGLARTLSGCARRLRGSMPSLREAEVALAASNENVGGDTS